MQPRNVVLIKIPLSCDKEAAKSTKKTKIINMLEYYYELMLSEALIVSISPGFESFTGQHHWFTVCLCVIFFLVIFLSFKSCAFQINTCCPSLDCVSYCIFKTSKDRSNKILMPKSKETKINKHCMNEKINK